MAPRLVAASCAVIGLWFVMLVPLHPNMFTGDTAQTVLDADLWKVTHGVMVLVGLAGIVVALASTNGWLLAVTVMSGVATAIAGGVEATTFPLLARSAPESLDFSSGLFRSPLFVAITGPWLLFPLCLAAIGWKVRAEAERLGTALAATGVAFFALGMWFVPVVGPLSSVALGAVLLWWAATLWVEPA